MKITWTDFELTVECSNMLQTEYYIHNLVIECYTKLNRKEAEMFLTLDESKVEGIYSKLTGLNKYHVSPGLWEEMSAKEKLDYIREKCYKK